MTSAKVKCDLTFKLDCKKNNLASIFTRAKFAIRARNYLCNKISRQILEPEIRNKHIKERKLTRQLKENINHINNKIGFICKIFSTAGDKRIM